MSAQEIFITLKEALNGRFQYKRKTLAVHEDLVLFVDLRATKAQQALHLEKRCRGNW